MQQMTLEWATQRIINMNNAWREQMVEILASLGMKSIRELRGRSDLLCYISDDTPPAAATAGVPSGAMIDTAPSEAGTPAGSGQVTR
jgi:hypothetical protein